MKKKICMVLVISIVMSLFLNINLNAFALQKDVSTSISFVTDDINEINFINNIEEKIKDKKLIDENKVTKVGYGELGKRIKNKGTKTPQKAVATLTEEDADTIAFSYKLLENESIVSYAKNQLEHGKNILFYGKNIDIKRFGEKFGLNNCIPNDSNIEKGLTSPGVETKKENHLYTFVGVDKTEFGNVLVTSEDTEYNLYRVVDFILKDAIHSKEVNETKPYNDFKGNDTESVVKEKSVLTSVADLFVNRAYAADISSFPIVNYQRKSVAFYPSGINNANYWYLITDCYLHRDGQYSDDPTYDYFILETISELNWAYNTDPSSVPIDKFYTKHQPFYSNDVVRDGGPKTQGGSTSVNVNLYPPEIGFSYTPGSNTKVSVSSYFTLSGNYFETTYSASGLFVNWFSDTKTIHRTDLSFSNYAPSSSLTYVKLNISQKARSYNNSNWYWAFNPTQYYYDY